MSTTASARRIRAQLSAQRSMRLKRVERRLDAGDYKAADLEMRKLDVITRVRTAQLARLEA
ncbi:hypothetical protein RPALISO_243 [Ruegeria phage RpAliso]|nr:hypothetical protein RPALISO_243 [Ruegeria phage RpAliso]